MILINNNEQKIEFRKKQKTHGNNLSLHEYKALLTLEAEKTLKLKRMLNASSKLTSLGYWEWDSAVGVPVLISKETAGMFATTQEIFYETCSTFENFIESWVHVDDRQRYAESIKKYRTENPSEVCDLEFRIIRADGDVRTLREVSNKFDVEGKKQQFYGTIQDITDEVRQDKKESLNREEAEDAIKERLMAFHKKFQGMMSLGNVSRNLPLEEFLDIHIQIAERVGHVYVGRDMLEQVKYNFKTLGDAQIIAQALANYCPDPKMAMLGIIELLLNSIEHGNLDIGYECKSKHLHNGDYSEEIERRLKMPRYNSKKATVEFKRSEDEINIIVNDQGSGFDWSRYLEFDPVRMRDLHGRGIAMAASICFSSLQYNACGNEVAGTISIK